MRACCEGFRDARLVGIGSGMHFLRIRALRHRSISDAGLFGLPPFLD